MTLTYKHSTWETEAEGLLWVQRQPGSHKQVQGQPAQHRLCLKKHTNKQKQNKQKKQDKTHYNLTQYSIHSVRWKED